MIDFPNATPAFTNAIPGLYIFNDFVNEQEEQQIVKGLDEGEGEHKWQKLLNRRVQHYGYEFKYGTNNVDLEKSIGTMPEFLTFLEPSKSSFLLILRRAFRCDEKV